MTKYKRMEWEELEGKTDLTPVEIEGKIYSIRYEDIPLLLRFTFSAILHDFTNTYFITMKGGRGIMVSNLKETDKTLEKIVTNQLPVIIRGYYLTRSCSISVDSINICGGGGRLSLVDKGEGEVSITDYGVISLKK